VRFGGLTGPAPNGGALPMTITVSIKGDKVFEWVATAEELEKLDEFVKKVAHENGETPEVMSKVALGYVEDRGGFSSQSGGEIPFLMWHLLSIPTNHPHRPGFLRDYIEDWHFDFDISGGPKKTINVTIGARTQGDHGENWDEGIKLN
jgi:hypothetical protein